MIKKTKERKIPQEAYKVKNYFVTPHAVQRMNERKITKGDLYYNLTRKPLDITKTKVDAMGRPSYRKTTKNKITSAINPINNHVVSVNKLHSKSYQKLINRTNQRRRTK